MLLPTMEDFRPIYFDTETTGISPAQDKIIEIAAYDSASNESFSSLINPHCIVPPEAIRVHGITQEMVDSAPEAKDVFQDFYAFCEGKSALIAHNNEAFDRPFLERAFASVQIEIPETWVFIDTLKWARRYRPDLPKHTLQYLREVHCIEANQAHRALDDVIILHKVFSAMIDDLPLWKVHEMLSAPRILSQMPFGKHKDKPLEMVPKDYIRWLHENGVFDKRGNEELKLSFQHLGILPKEEELI
jgi:DNA polymerase III subunit epsilon